MQMDGIHPNIKAQPIIATIVAKQLERLLLP
jgi:lysophospholipase L1-like esterase